MTTTRSLLAATALSAAFAAACGGAAPPESSPAKSATSPDLVGAAPEPSSIEEAQAQIARASDDLNGGKGRTSTNTPPGDAPPKPAPPVTPAEPSATSTAKTEESCVSPCRALASMRRAVDALCRMAGDTDKRCTDARQTLSDSISRTAACKCSS